MGYQRLGWAAVGKHPGRLVCEEQWLRGRSGGGWSPRLGRRFGWQPSCRLQVAGFLLVPIPKLSLVKPIELALINLKYVTPT